MTSSVEMPAFHLQSFGSVFSALMHSLHFWFVSFNGQMLYYYSFIFIIIAIIIIGSGITVFVLHVFCCTTKTQACVPHS